MSHITDAELDELREALDYLWGEADASLVKHMSASRPDLLDTCVHNHRRVAHSNPTGHL